MELIKIKIQVKDGDKEALLASFFAHGCDGLEETPTGALVYFTDALMVKPALAALHQLFDFEHDVAVLPETNWNAVWESAYNPIAIGQFVYIRAPFHPKKSGFEHDLIIEPKMSFGTGHHQTTCMLLEHMQKFDFRSLKVLDMGAGTGILAILAHKLGAFEVLAVDIDPWSVENAIENCERNNADSVKVQLGTMQDVKSHFDVILANINRNIILDDLANYAAALNVNGLLFTSGFFESDVENIKNAAFNNGFSEVAKTNKNEWASLVFKKDV